MKEVKDDAIGRNFANERSQVNPDPAVAEAATDYAYELIPVLERQDRAGDYRSESVPDVDELTVGDFVATRGRPDGEPVGYQVSMNVWVITNTYYEIVAGPEFQEGALPKDLDFDATEGAD